MVFDNCLGCNEHGVILSFIMDNPLVLAFMVFTIFLLILVFSLYREKEQEIKQVKQIISTYERGVSKRIEENREILAILRKDCPELIERCFWIEGLLVSQERFLKRLAELSGERKA